MLKFKWEMNGRPIRSDQIGNELAKSIRQAANTQLEKAVKGVRCPVHGRVAQNVRLRSGSSSKMDVTYEACCDELKAAIARQLS